MTRIRLKRTLWLATVVLATLGAWESCNAAEAGRPNSGKALPSQAAKAETLFSALASAYESNPELNAQRAVVRQLDETVPQALSGYRPSVFGNASAGAVRTEIEAKNGFRQRTETTPKVVGITGSQTLYNGSVTGNRVRAAESSVSAARETLRVMEQTILLSAATIYMDVLRDTAVVQVLRSNVTVLEELLRQTQERFNVGEVTPTDVAQAEAQLAASRSVAADANSALAISRAQFRRIIGRDPAALGPGTPVDRHVPPTIAEAISLGLTQNPAVTASMFGVDVGRIQVKIAEGFLLPTLVLTLSAQRQFTSVEGLSHLTTMSGLVGLTVPIYQGGAEYASVRQAKEAVSERGLRLEAVRDQVRVAVVQSWSQVDATKFKVGSAQQQIAAAEKALNGIRAEARQGQRTTFDVLAAQQVLVNARLALVTAQHDRVVASYNLLSSVGRLSLQVLDIKAPLYDPSVHYHQVRDSWFGVRTPDGR